MSFSGVIPPEVWRFIGVLSFGIWFFNELHQPRHLILAPKVQWFHEPFKIPHVPFWWLCHLEMGIRICREAQRQREATFLQGRIGNLLKMIPQSSAVSPRVTPAQLQQGRFSSKPNHSKPGSSGAGWAMPTLWLMITNFICGSSKIPTQSQSCTGRVGSAGGTTLILTQGRSWIRGY